MRRLSLVPTLLALTGGVIAGKVIHDLAQGDDLSGEVVLVTGASRGLGLLLAREFAREGCQVVLCARVQEELEQAIQQFRAWGVDADAMVCDVSDKNAVQYLIDQVLQRFGRVDILVNNAGTIQAGPIENATLSDFEQAMGTMFWGGLYTTMALLPHMQQRGSGRIVNVTSIGGKVAVPHLLPYTAAKFAMTGFSEGLTAELMDSGIRVTTIIPGLMRTGSYLNAFFRGHQQDEYRWFSLGDNLPFISIDAEKAAREIVWAVKRGEVEHTLTIPARMIARFYGALPDAAIRIMGLADQLILPSPAPVGVKVRGSNIQQWMNEPLFNWLTGWGRSAADRFNQHSAPESNDEPLPTQSQR